MFDIKLTYVKEDVVVLPEIGITGSDFFGRRDFRGVLKELEFKMKDFVNIALAVEFIRNHSGGEFKPSNTDMEITGKIKTAGKIMDIRLRDHLIIGNSGYFSFADEGIL